MFIEARFLKIGPVPISRIYQTGMTPINKPQTNLYLLISFNKIIEI